ncbi:hypothetical protein CMK11_06170 [Candidatus Poribacteria bacterium]|nr:hypothetical protein [Candidatus Poribacteria bacterium]
MDVTSIDVRGEAFLINGAPTYAEIDGSDPAAHGLLMNARFIQGVFDDRAQPERFARFGHEEWDAEGNTDRLVDALPAWHAHGLRAFTVGLQGGGPVFTIDDWRTIDNNPFGADGRCFDAGYAGRLDRLIRGADAAGMVVIVSFLYASQGPRLRDGRAVRSAVATASRFLRDGGYSNVIIEVANEHNLNGFSNHPIVQSVEGITYLMDLARQESGGMLVGCSGTGGYASREVADASDVILIHGNGCSRQRYYDLVRTTQAYGLGRPIVCNEDSPCFSRLGVAYQTRTSWGYYNNLTKQEPPADWSITPGEDVFFARRMAEGIGIDLPPLEPGDEYYLQGFEPDITLDGKRWVRLASLYPEKVDRVEYWRNGERIDVAYDEPFFVDYRTTWIQGPVIERADDREWRARIFQTDGAVVEKVVNV